MGNKPFKTFQSPDTDKEKSQPVKFYNFCSFSYLVTVVIFSLFSLPDLYILLLVALCFIVFHIPGRDGESGAAMEKSALFFSEH